MYNYIIKKLSIDSLYLKKGIKLVCILILCVSVGAGHYYLRLNNQRLEIINKINLTNEMVIKPLKEDLSNILKENNNKLHNDNKSTMTLSGISYYVMNSNQENDPILIGKIFDIPSIIIHKSPKSIFIKISDIETKVRRILPKYINIYILESDDESNKLRNVIANLSLVEDKIKIIFIIDKKFEDSFKKSLLLKSILHSFMIVSTLISIVVLVYPYYKRRLLLDLKYNYRKLNQDYNIVKRQHDELAKELILLKAASRFETCTNYSIFSKIILERFSHDDDCEQYQLLVKKFILAESSKLTTSIINLSQLKTDVQHFFQSSIISKEIEFLFLSNVINLNIPYCKDFFYQIIFSLIYNRLYGCKAKGDSIRLEVTQNEDYIEISCKDNSLNIDIYHIDRLSEVIDKKNFLIFPWTLINESLKEGNYNFEFKRENESNICILRLFYNNLSVIKDNNICYIKDYLQ